MKKIAVLTIMTGLFLFGVKMCLAVGEVGSKVELSFKALDGTDINIDNFKGKIVIIDFWATWCGPCMQQVPHMVETSKKYKDKGVQIIGISLDRAGEKEKLLKTLTDKHMDWPQYFDGLFWENKIAKAWGVRGIPLTAIVGPDGTLLWKGHPAALDGALADALKNHPPQAAEKKDDK